MIFTTPWAFALFAPLALILATRFVARGGEAFSFSSLRAVGAAGKSLRQRLLWIVPVAEMLAATLFIFALARPQEGVRQIKDTTEGIAIEMLMDISSSMSISMRNTANRDSRLSVAKRVFEDFITGDGNELDGRSTDMIGLITFARYPNTVCPLTLSHDMLVYFARELQIEERPNEDGTAFGDAVAIGAARLQSVEAATWAQTAKVSGSYRICGKVIILLTDGENNCGRHLPLEAAALARKWGVRVYTIGFGEQKARVRLRPGAPRTTRPLDAVDENLWRIADMTGGVFRRAHDEESLRAVYKEIDKLEKLQFAELGHIDYQERFMPFAAVGVLLLFLSVVLKTTWLRKT